MWEFLSTGELISCSSDQSTIIWTCSDEIWMEKYRFGVIGGQIPGGYGAKFLHDVVICYGFQGAIQIWRLEEVLTGDNEENKNKRLLCMNIYSLVY